MSILDDNLKEAITFHGLVPEVYFKTHPFKDRHPSSIHMLKVLAPNPNLNGTPRSISDSCFELAWDMFEQLPDGPELTAGLRKLLEAKDAFVRASLDENPVDYRDR